MANELNECNAMPTIAVSDLQTSRKFYEEVLGLSVQEETPEAGVVVYKSGSGAVQVYQTSSAGTNQATYATWEVDDIDAAVAALSDRGVTFEHFPDIPGVTLEGDIHIWGAEKAAWFKDPDGNTLCLHGRS